MPIVNSTMWIDDLAVPVFAPSQSLLSRTKIGITCIHDSFTQYGLELNMKLGKTVAMLGFCWSEVRTGPQLFLDSP